MIDAHAAKLLLEFCSIMRAHVANCTFIEQATVRSRNLERLDALERALVAAPDKEPPKAA